MNLKIIPESYQLMELMNNPQKSMEDVIIIFKKLTNLQFLQHFIGTQLKGYRKEDIFYLYSSMRVEQFKGGQVVYSEADHSNEKLYIVFYGSVIVMQKKTLSNQNDEQNVVEDYKEQENQSPSVALTQLLVAKRVTKKFTSSQKERVISDYEKLKLISRYGKISNYIYKDSGFGEEALLKDSLRSQTVVANSNELLLFVLTKKAFIKVKNRLEKIHKDKQTLLEQIFQCDSIKPQILENMISLCSILELDKNSIIYEENTQGEYFYIIQSGEVELTKIYSSQIEDQTKKESVRICVLGQFNIIGEEITIYENEKYDFSTKVVSAQAILYKIPLAQFKHKFPQECKDQITNEYPMKIKNRQQIYEKNSKFSRRLEVSRPNSSQLLRQNFFSLNSEYQHQDKSILSSNKIKQNQINKRQRSAVVKTQKDFMISRKRFDGINANISPSVSNNCIQFIVNQQKEQYDRKFSFINQIDQTISLEKKDFKPFDFGKNDNDLIPRKYKLMQPKSSPSKSPQKQTKSSVATLNILQNVLMSRYKKSIIRQEKRDRRMVSSFVSNSTFYERPKSNGFSQLCVALKKNKSTEFHGILDSKYSLGEEYKVKSFVPISIYLYKNDKAWFKHLELLNFLFIIFKFIQIQKNVKLVFPGYYTTKKITVSRTQQKIISPNEDSIAWTAQQNKLMSVCAFDSSDLVNVQSRDRKRALQCELMEPQQFAYDSVETDAKTQSLYVKLCRPLIKQSLQGYHVTIMCYGQTTSGKTYTMLGDFNNPGIIPCAIRDIFNWKQNEDFNVQVQYLQIYNEQLDDLLSNTSKSQIIDDPKWGTTVTGSERIKVNSFEEAMSLINKGEQNRVYKATKIHEHSSRSHTLLKLVFYLFLFLFQQYIQHQHHSKSTYACINLIDLAGSERLSDADTSCQNETGYINKSLFALTNVIKRLSEKQKHIPFRDSKLTRLLTDSIGGNSNTLMICCASPAKKNFFQTLSTLKFANLAKLIKNSPQQGIIYDAEDPRDQEIQRLQNELKKATSMITILTEENIQFQRNLEEQNMSIIPRHQSQSSFDPQGSILNFSDILNLYDQLPFDQRGLQKIRDAEGDYRQNLKKLQSELCEQLNNIQVKDQNIQKLIWLIQTQLKVQDLMSRDWSEFVHIDDILDKIQLPTQKQDFFLQLEKIEQQTALVLQTLYQEAKISSIVELSRRKQIETIFGVNVSTNEDQSHLERQFKNSLDHLRQIMNMITDAIKSSQKTTINAEIIQLIKQKQRQPLKQLNQSVLTQSQKHSKKQSNISVSQYSTAYTTVVWGSNQDGRLGVGNNVQIARKAMNLMKKFSQISCGSHHTVAITSDGQIYSWGRGLKGQLGLGHNENISDPQRIGLNQAIIQVACGWQHTICLDQQGYVYSWGYGEDGQLGIGELKNHNTPQLINQQSETISIWAGHSTSAFITSEDELYCCGSNWDGRCMSDKLGILAYPELIMKNQLRSLSMGVSHMGVVLNDGSLVMSGIGTEGQLGTLLEQQSTDPYVFKIERASEDLGGSEEQITYDVDLATPCIYVEKFSSGGCTQVACGDRFTLVLTENERVYSFGKQSYRRLGLNTQDNIYEPTIIMTLKDVRVRNIQAGFRHGGVVSKDCDLYMWGFNFHNQIGLGQNDEDQVFPVKVLEKVEQVSLGYFHSAALIKE